MSRADAMDEPETDLNRSGFIDTGRIEEMKPENPDVLQKFTILPKQNGPALSGRPIQIMLS